MFEYEKLDVNTVEDIIQHVKSGLGWTTDLYLLNAVENEDLAIAARDILSQEGLLFDEIILSEMRWASDEIPPVSARAHY